MSNNNLRVVQAGVTSTNGNALQLGTGYKVSTGPMPVAPRNKPWFKSWHPFNPQNMSNGRSGKI